MHAPLTTARRRPHSRLVGALVAILSVGVLAACGSAAARDANGEVTTIRYQSYAGSVDVLQLADALGYLHGLTLKKVGDVTGGPQSVQALVSHQIDISSSCFFGSIAQLVHLAERLESYEPSESGDEAPRVLAEVKVMDRS